MRFTRRTAFASLLWLGGVSACGGAPAPTLLSVQHGRTLLEPSRLAVVSSEREAGQVPSAVSLGGPRSGTVLLYLEFPLPRPRRRLVRADLVLEVSGTPGSSVEVEVSGSDFADGSPASFAEPRSVGARTTAELRVDGAPARLDVREVVSSQSEATQLRLLLRAAPRAPEPLLVATGVSGGMAPRLDLYWQ